MGTAFLHGSGGNNPPELLWKNSKPASGLEATTYEDDWSAYEWFIVGFRLHISVDAYRWILVHKGETAHIDSAYGFISRTRSIKITDNGVTIQAAVKTAYNSSSSTTDNEGAVITEIYGIKGGSA